MPVIDWNLPIETDEPTPRAAFPTHTGGWGGKHVSIEGHGSLFYNSKGWVPYGPPLRNVRPAVADGKPIRTSDEALRRMEALVRRIASYDQSLGTIPAPTDEAREIVKLLPEPPVDPDEAEARRLQDTCVVTNGKIHTLVVSAIKRGRAMEREQYVPCGSTANRDHEWPTYERLDERNR